MKFSERYCLKRQRRLLLGGLGAWPPRKFLNMSFLGVPTGHFANNIHDYNPYNPFGIKLLEFIWYFLQFLQFFRTSELSILHFVFVYENLTKISQHESKSEFFRSRSHIGRGSGFSSKIGMILTKSGVLDNLHKLMGIICFSANVRQCNIAESIVPVHGACLKFFFIIINFYNAFSVQAMVAG